MSDGEISSEDSEPVEYNGSEGEIGPESYADSDVEEVVADPELRTAFVPVPGGLGSSSAMSIDDILAIMRKSGIHGYSINATDPQGNYGPPHANDGGFHSSHQAVDLGGNGSATIRDQIAKFWYQFTPNILELIHSHTSYSPYSGWYVKNGRVVHPYGPASAHYNHVHIAIRQDAAQAILKKLGGSAPVIPPKPTGIPAYAFYPVPIPGGPADARLVPYNQCPRICVGTGGKNSPPAEAAWVGYFLRLFVRFSPHYWVLAVERGTKVENYKEADTAFLGAVAQMAHDYKIPWAGCIDDGIWDLYQPHTPGSRTS